MTDEEGNLIRYKIKPHFKGQSADKRNGEIYGEFLSSRFSKALGFFADDEWVADVNCPDCEKSLTKSFRGRAGRRFNPPRGIEMSLGRGIDVNCNGKDAAAWQNHFRGCVGGARAPRSMLSNCGSRSSITATRKPIITSSRV